jgi:hypothetical protein
MIQLTRFSSADTAFVDAKQHTWPLKVTAVSSEPGLPSEIFVYQASAPQDKFNADMFSCISSVQQLTELPKDAPVTVGTTIVPFYRKNTVEFHCRSEAEYQDVWTRIQEDVQTLLTNFRAFADMQTVETVDIQ